MVCWLWLWDAVLLHVPSLTDTRADVEESSNSCTDSKIIRQNKKTKIPNNITQYLPLVSSHMQTRQENLLFLNILLLLFSTFRNKYISNKQSNSTLETSVLFLKNLSMKNSIVESKFLKLYSSSCYWAQLSVMFSC